MTWKCITSFGHPVKLNRKKKLIVYSETEEVTKASADEKFPEGAFFNTMTKCEIYLLLHLPRVNGTGNSNGSKGPATPT